MQSDTGNADTAPTGTETPNADPAVLRLCRGVRAGDRAAFTALYNVWYERWMRDAAGVLDRSDPLCSDIVQEAFVRVIKSLPECPCEQALAAWMKRALRSSAVDVLRRESRRTAREQSWRPTEAGQRPTAEAVVWVAAALASLEAEEAMLVRARVVSGLTLEESGRMAGVSGDAAHGRVRRALAKLRAAWKGESEC